MKKRKAQIQRKNDDFLEKPEESSLDHSKKDDKQPNGQVELLLDRLKKDDKQPNGPEELLPKEWSDWPKAP